MKKWIIPVLFVAGIAALATSCLSPHSGKSTGNVVFNLNIPSSVRVKDGSIELVCANKTKSSRFECILPGQTKIAVPEGVYFVSNAYFTVSDKNGIPWASDFVLPKPVVVTSGTDTQIKIGIPITVQIVPDAGQLSRSRESHLWLKITGVGGETYKDIALQNSRMIPSVKLISNDGIVAAQGNMEYG